jgi:hypothetical protein
VVLRFLHLIGWSGAGQVLLSRNVLQLTDTASVSLSEKSAISAHINYFSVQLIYFTSVKFIVFLHVDKIAILSNMRLLDKITVAQLVRNSS